MRNESHGGGKVIAHIAVYFYSGSAEEHPQEEALVIETSFDENGRETLCEYDGKKTFSRYDESGLLVEERNVCEDYLETKAFEYTPDGELFHTRTERKVLSVYWCYPVLPNGNLDTSAGQREYSGLVPTGYTEDEWISWEQDGKVRVTQTRTTREDGRIEECTRKVFREGEEPDDDYEYDYDEEGNWIRCRRCDRVRGILMEVVREIEYW